MVNDTVGVMVSCACEQQPCEIGVILGEQDIYMCMLVVLEGLWMLYFMLFNRELAHSFEILPGKKNTGCVHEEKLRQQSIACFEVTYSRTTGLTNHPGNKTEGGRLFCTGIPEDLPFHLNGKY